MAKIHQAICDIINDCPAISKGQKNSQQGFMYRGIDVVMSVFQPLLARHRVFIVPDVLEITREERTTKNGGSLTYTILQMRYTFYAEDGSSVSAVVQGEAMDSADKSCNKAMSVAFKYALFQVFCIPTEEMQDPDKDSPQPAPKEYKCSECEEPFKGYTAKNGKVFNAMQEYQIMEMQCQKEGINQILCSECYKRRKGVITNVE